MFLAHLCNGPPNSISFFTDGSKVSRRVGAACYSPDLNTFSLLGLHSYFSIFSAECIAIKNAIKMALESSHDNVFIYSDSLSALQALIKSSVTINTNLFILDIRSLLNRYSSRNRKLYFYWILFHIGITFNDKTNSLAKEEIDVLMSHQTYSLIFPIALKSRLGRKQKDRISRNLNLRVKNFSKVITILLLTHGFHVENSLETLFAGRTDFEQITYN